MEFDIYHPLDSAEFLSGFVEGARIELDGIDGFFDQYFEARSPGALIRFVPSLPTDRAEFESLPLIEASIESCDSISGTVFVRSITPFEHWMMNLSGDSMADTDPYGEVDSILEELPEYAARNSFYWTRPQAGRSRHHRSTVNALLGIPTEGGFRLAAFTSNETSSIVLRRQPKGEQAEALKP